ncbi:MAG: Pyridoxine/pyridoxamine 5'-phosphate oxidase [Elusimicrobia bacterium]|nr:Pyridoxine/pyridoxamine 5'-phosphate oxidase [Elusimicrobiota bacterium]
MDLYQEALQKFAEVFERAKLSEASDPNAMVVATASADGRPSSRTLLLKGFDSHGFVFYTNHESRKAQHLMANPRVSLTFYWKSLMEQVHIEGTVTAVTPEEADVYWKTRPRESQIGAWASLQSRVLDHRKTLEDRVEEFNKKYTHHEVPRPPWWSGFRVKPNRIEFWKGEAFRLHYRTLYESQGGAWKKHLLFP